jgi:CheY-like chemotaxis protein
MSTELHSSRRVLVVEDQRDSRETLAALLKLCGFDVETASDGFQGVQKALSWRPNAAVIDIGLPLLNGYDVARQIRALVRDHILLIALTAYNQPEDRQRSFEAGFNFHVAKPADFEALQRLLSR